MNKKQEFENMTVGLKINKTLKNQYVTHFSISILGRFLQCSRVGYINSYYKYKFIVYMIR